MPSSNQTLSRRHFCLCCVGGAATAMAGWLTPRQAFAEARGLVSLIKDSAATSPITTTKLRNNISVLEGSGGNIAVLTGSDGKMLVDAGIGVSRAQMTKALAELGPEPITHLINTHWHFDHADGNTWLHAAGAKIVAQNNTRKHLSGVLRVEDWDYNFVPPPAGGLPTDVFDKEHKMKLNGLSLALKHYAPAHTDSDISVTFAEANVMHVGDTFWNGIYPFIDYSTGGSIDGQIAAAEANLAVADKDTIVISGHGKPVGNKAELQEFRDVLATGARQCRQAQETGQDQGRNGRGQTVSRVRRQMGSVRDRPGFLHPAGLRGRVTTGGETGGIV